MLLCMRTTIDLDEPVFRQLKHEAARRGTTLRELVNEYLRKASPKRSASPNTASTGRWTAEGNSCPACGWMTASLFGT
jgi:hypothetical protein